ncbi:MAG: Crp/Fnr family transcriptional regulator [Anaerolineaceae bacterium]|nr:Crp/Fnr family transcriptional regulator [Anaerolineaceae bacterium]
MQYQFPIFENLCPSWEEVSHLGIRRFFQKGSEIISLVSMMDGIYYLKDGSVEVPLYTQNGPEKVLFHVGPGCVFGEITCFVAGENYDEASVRARTDCILYFFSRDMIENTIATQYPHLLIELIQASAYKIRMYGVLLRDTLNSDNFVRVCKMLIYLIQFKGVDIKGKTQVTICPGITQIDIAKLMGVHRVTVTKAISRLKALGVVKHFSKNLLEISDLQQLSQIIEDSET